MQMTEDVRGVVEISITPLDQFYYVSRESRDTFSTKPYIMHTALYYALGFLPTRFRVSEQSPSYKEHFLRSGLVAGLYLHPAQVVGEEDYRTRRFSVKGDAYRTEPVQENKNLLETGHQRTIEPDIGFRTFAVCRGNRDPATIADRLGPYVRVGKKMTTARIRTAVHAVEARDGTFDLGQPVARTDLKSSQYQFLGSIKTEAMAPVDLITECELEGTYATVDPTFGPGSSGTVALPVRADFLGIDE